MKKAKKRKSQTRIAMVSITFVVGVLFVGMMGKSVALQNQLSSYDSQIKELDQHYLCGRPSVCGNDGEECCAGEPAFFL